MLQQNVHKQIKIPLVSFSYILSLRAIHYYYSEEIMSNCITYHFAWVISKHVTSKVQSLYFLKEFSSNFFNLPRIHLGKCFLSPCKRIWTRQAILSLSDFWLFKVFLSSIPSHSRPPTFSPEKAPGYIYSPL